MPGVLAMLAGPEPWWEQDKVWFRDNAVTMSVTVKSGSGAPDGDQGAAAVQLACAFLRLRIWWEYVGNKASWADEASRLLETDPPAEKKDLKLRLVDAPVWPWEVPSDELVERLQKVLRAALDRASGEAAVQSAPGGVEASKGAELPRERKEEEKSSGGRPRLG